MLAPARTQPRLRFHGNVAAPVPKRRRHRLGRATTGHATLRPRHAAPGHDTPAHARLPRRGGRPLRHTACERRPPAGQEECITSHVTTTARTPSPVALAAIVTKNQYGSPAGHRPADGRTDNRLMADSHGVAHLTTPRRPMMM